MARTLASAVAVCCTVPVSLAAAGLTVTFDDIPVGTIGNAYLASGVMFLRGNSTFCNSTGPMTFPDGSPVTASVFSCCAISGNHIIIPGLAANNDIIVRFYDPCGHRAATSLVSIANDAEASPNQISITAYDVNGGPIGTSIATGPGGIAQVITPGIWEAHICSVSSSGLLGCDNFTFVPPLASPSSGDLNGDCKVNAADLSILLGAWGSSASPADLTGDGIVDAADLSLLLGQWTG